MGNGKIMSRECHCKEWEYNIPKLNSGITIAKIHGMDVTGDIFNYCPWCGNALATNEKLKNETE